MTLSTTRRLWRIWRLLSRVLRSFVLWVFSFSVFVSWYLLLPWCWRVDRGSSLFHEENDKMWLKDGHAKITVFLFFPFESLLLWLKVIEIETYCLCMFVLSKVKWSFFSNCLRNLWFLCYCIFPLLLGFMLKIDNGEGAESLLFDFDRLCWTR